MLMSIVCVPRLNPIRAHPFYVRTVWGVGYRFVDPSAQEF